MKDPISPWIVDETSPLEAVVLGTTADHGPFNLNNPIIREHAQKGTLPTDESLNRESEEFSQVLVAHGVQVIRPPNAPDLLQTFTRDLGFVIGDKFVWANLKRDNRRPEIEQLRPVIEAIVGQNIVTVPPEIFVEGGDIVMIQGRVLVGVGQDSRLSRTSPEAVDFLRRTFPDRDVIRIHTTTRDDDGADPRVYPLHLDCAFQPAGPGHAIFYEGGFAGRPEAIFDLIGESNLLRVSGSDMFALRPNLFSIAPDKMVSAPSFTGINDALRRIGITVVEVPYEEVGKLGGLFRCSTLPLRRRPLTAQGIKAA